MGNPEDSVAVSIGPVAPVGAIGATRTFNRAADQYRVGRYSDALPIAEQALQEAGAPGQPATEFTFDCTDLLAQVNLQLGNREEAQHLAQRALSGYRHLARGAAGDDVATRDRLLEKASDSKVVLAAVYWAMFRFEKALRAAFAAKEEYAEMLGANHRKTDRAESMLREIKRARRRMTALVALCVVVTIALVAAVLVVLLQGQGWFPFVRLHESVFSTAFTIVEKALQASG